jgi:hypothetical protein
MSGFFVRNVLLAVVCTGLVSACGHVLPAQPVTNQQTAGCDSKCRSDGVQTAIRHLLRARESANPELAADLSDGIAALLPLLDDQSEHSMAVLAVLGTFYLGEYPGEIHSCLVQRRGESIVPFLDPAWVRNSGHDCQSLLGKSSSTCLTDSDRRLAVLATRARSGEECIIEQ